MKHENKDHSCFELVQLLISISIPIAIGIHTVLENNSKLITYRSDEYRPPVLLQSANLPDLNLIAESERRVLYNLSLEGIIMTSADFYEINIRGARLNSSILNHVDFSSPWNTPSFDDEIGTFKSNSSQLLFEKTNLTYASFVFVTNEKAAFTLTIMDNASLGAFFSCSNCIFDFTDMAGVNFEKC
ncbi:unnamed protein product [Rotaria socialis]|uniref:Uncharacterized protein n=1 Tax=Rotaria socialis TaxID=392032 RepID=A0A820TKW7_9BILA|nr:unnamed protein product [Rotaria socialis]CAF3369474.1 unnamed protein product [Rotaria socialis]CAF4218397.1 unnamed protein product [Rotaria socialis]CAF4312536.1 unnamed protein product [Rotaria socialis]CAF4468560.1 unnamed protein product [Rotaria socialis]